MKQEEFTSIVSEKLMSDFASGIDSRPNVSFRIDDKGNVISASINGVNLHLGNSEMSEMSYHQNRYNVSVNLGSYGSALFHATKMIHLMWNKIERKHCE